MLTLAEDLFHGDIAIRPRFLAQFFHVAFRIGKPVDMVDAQPVHRAGAHQFKEQPMRILKHRLVFDAHPHQPVDFKEAAER